VAPYVIQRDGRNTNQMRNKSV